MPKIQLSYYRENPTLWIAKDLLGKVLITRSAKGYVTSGLIIETEAYLGIDDRASHAYNNRFTGRTSTMYLEGGVAYVYLCYGIHYLFNIVTEKTLIPNAVLVRVILATYGIGEMAKRLSKGKLNNVILKGPGTLSKALGIDLTFNREALNGPRVWLEDHGIRPNPSSIIECQRVGVGYAGQDALLPYRFYIDPEILAVDRISLRN